MSIFRFLFTSLAGAGALLGVVIVVVCTVALGPLFWVPYAILYVMLRASGLTPRQLRRRPAAKHARPDPGISLPIVFVPTPEPQPVAPPASIFDTPPRGPSSLD